MAVAFELEGEDERDAFAELYREVRSPLVAHCRRLVGPSGDAEELAQEALVRAWRSWDADSGRPFWPWVLTVARNLVVDAHRRTTRRAELTPLAALSLNGDRFPNPEDEAVRAAEHEAVRVAFEGLPVPYRTVVELHHVEGRSYQEIADLQQVTTETVRGMLRRARHALRAAYLRLDAVPAVVAVSVAMKRFRARVDDLAVRAQVRMGDSSVLVVPAEAMRSAIVLALVVGAGSGAVAPPTPAQDVPVAAAPATADDRGTTSSTRGPGRSTAPRGVMGGDSGMTALPAPAVPLGLGGDTATTPEEAWFEDITVSSDGSTVFASGTSTTSCPSVSCPVLFRSDDAGRSWRRVASSTFRGGDVMLPPAWPADQRIFALGATALTESADGGATFVARTPAGRTGAMSPAFSSGDPVIWVGFAPGWVYHDDTKAVTPLDMWPVPVADYATYAFSPAWASDRRVLLGGWGLGPDGVQSATVSVCRASRCDMPAVLPGLIGSPSLLTAPSYPRTGLAFAWANSRLLRSTDGGHTFAGLQLPGTGHVSALTVGADGRLYLGLAGATTQGPRGGLYVSDDDGSTWRSIGAGTRLAYGVSSVSPLPNGHILAAVDGLAGGGLTCSVDDGRTWATRC